MVAGRVVACKLVKAACRRHLKDLKRPKAWGYYYDAWHGDDVCDFIEKLPHVQGQWDTKTLHLEPAQIFILTTVFGWRRRTDQRRRFSYVYIEMARKGAKSTLTAGIALYCLTCEGEVGPEIYVGATTGAQALKVFEPAKKMAKRTPALQEAFDLKIWSKSIECGDSGGFIQTVNAKGSTQDGHNPHVAILDELHAHKDRALFDVMKSAMGARKAPLLWIITTAGFNTHGICYEQRDYVSKVLNGILEAEHVFAIVFTLDENDDPYDEKNWPKANPMLGITPTWEQMRKDAADARASPAADANFRTKNLNLWLNAVSAWLNMVRWQQCADTTLDWADFEGLDCWIGGDLADKDDICALVLCAFRPSPTLPGETQLIVKPIFYLPAAVLDEAQHADGSGVAPYLSWERQGFLTLMPGDWIDHNQVRDQIRAWKIRFAAKHATGDQFASFLAMASQLNEEFEQDPPFAQVLHKSAKAVTDPARELEARVKSGRGRFLHDGNPVMTWMASNVVIAPRRDGTILPIKPKANSPLKIDGIDGIINAIEPAVRVGEHKATGSYLDEGEVLVF